MSLVPSRLQKGNSHRLSAGGFCFCLFTFVCLSVLLCSLGCPETNSLDQAGLELRKIRCWDKGYVPPHLALFMIF